MQQAILLVDDTASALALFSARLKKAGFQVYRAQSAAQGLALLNQHPDICMVVSDWHMPDCSGPQFCQMLKRDHERHLSEPRYLFFILLSAIEESGVIAQGIAAGADDFIAKTATNDELVARISAGFRTLSLHYQLAQQNQQLQQAYDALSNQLHFAAKLQHNLLPAEQVLDAPVQFDGLYQPAEQLGGDMYGVRDHGEVTSFFLLDIAGHGVPSALLTFAVVNAIDDIERQLFSSMPECWRDIAAQLVTQLNEQFLMEDMLGRYFTMIYGLIEHRSGQLIWVNAGHPAPLRIAPAGDKWQQLEGQQPAVGFIENYRYEAQETALHVGERLFCFSDGVIEAKNQQGEQWQLAHLQQCIQKSYAPELFARIQADLQRWKTGDVPDDDITLLQLTWQGDCAASESSTFYRYQTVTYDIVRHLRHAFSDFLISTLAAHHAEITSTRLQAILLVLTEAMNNVVEHAYEERLGPMSVMAKWQPSGSAEQEMLMVEICDWGKTRTTHATEQDLALDATSGRGLNIMAQLSNFLRYERLAEKNCLQLGFELSRLPAHSLLDET
ncbi:Regulator of RpoS [Vibrio stylophorae]|uniref:Regulator of RpoS n=1 Tax=Vibrio stylophorae TaxID=659351 RepID=A0ABM8ZSY6_9VIBR|nr:SpoIIE family protein phosphatase [Vibrio stylophorae]CAH0533406.1 Regulator of RpoS [Vibrio stylophorae]